MRLEVNSSYIFLNLSVPSSLGSLVSYATAINNKLYLESLEKFPLQRQFETIRHASYARIRTLYSNSFSEEPICLAMP